MMKPRIGYPLDRRNRRWVGVGVAAMALGAASQAATPPRYTVQLLEGLEGYDPFVDSINESGTITGNLYFFDGPNVYAHAVYWDDRGLQLLNEEPVCCIEAGGINGAGDIAGQDESNDAVLWLAGGGETIKLGDFDSSLYGGMGVDVNDLGQVCGADIAQMGSIPFVWDSGVLKRLALIPGTDGGNANAINNRGQIVGSCQRACFWPGPNEVIDLGTLGGEMSIAADINERSQIVGRSDLEGTSRIGAFLWEDGEMTALPIDPTVSASAHAINNRGWIVGSSAVSSLWIDGVLYDLQALAVDAEGIRLDVAYDINDRGQIAVNAVVDGRQFAAILTPTFELQAPSPGRSGEVNTLAVEGAVPGHRIYFLYSLESGARNVPRCPGVQVDLASPNLIGSDVANRFGVAKVEALVPGRAAGRLVHLQAVDATGCVVTEPLDFTFE